MNNQKEKDYDQLLKEWKQKFKDDWDYKRKLVIFQDGDNNLFTPTTTTTTTTTTPVPITKPTGNVTIVITNLTPTTPRTGEQVTSGPSTDILKLAGITVGVLVGFLLIAVVCIMLCRRSKKKKRRDVSVRRPLGGPEPEDHIYAEIEPLQYDRTNNSGGASGGTSDIPLPARKRRRGISSFSGLSTRIQKFFSVKKSDDNQSVFYNRNGESGMQSVAEAPEPPERNINGNRKDRRVKRFESTASRRPLLDGDSQISQPSTSSVELRNSTYNALIKTDEGRQSGPYDTLNRAKSSNDDVEGDEPSSPHDYFKLEKNKFSEDEDSPVYNGDNDIVIVEHEGGNMETIEESEAENDAESVQPHDYFVLEPHDREKSKKGKSSDQTSTDQKSAASDKATKEKVDSGEGDLASVSENTKPTPKPRVSKTTSGETSPSQDGEAKNTSPESEDKGKTMNDYIAYSALTSRGNSKDDDYEISKLGEAPKPPEGAAAEDETEEENDYLKPVEEKARVYVDVFPNPPPRTTSLLHDSDIHQKDLLPNTKDSTSSTVSSPSKPVGSPTKRRNSPSKSPTKSQHSPKTSPIKSAGSPVKVAGTPTKSVGSPVKLTGSPTKSTETEV